MARTEIDGGQILDGSVQRKDLDDTTIGQSVIKKLTVIGRGIVKTFTGTDDGTGDVEIKIDQLKRVYTDELITVEDNEVFRMHSPVLKGTSRILVKGSGRVIM